MQNSHLLVTSRYTNSYIYARTQKIENIIYIKMSKVRPKFNDKVNPTLAFTSHCSVAGHKPTVVSFVVVLTQMSLSSEEHEPKKYYYLRLCNCISERKGWRQRASHPDNPFSSPPPSPPLWCNTLLYKIYPVKAKACTSWALPCNFVE